VFRRVLAEGRGSSVTAIRSKIGPSTCGLITPPTAQNTTAWLSDDMGKMNHEMPPLSGQCGMNDQESATKQRARRCKLNRLNQLRARRCSAW